MSFIHSNASHFNKINSVIKIYNFTSTATSSASVFAYCEFIIIFKHDNDANSLKDYYYELLVKKIHKNINSL